MCLAGVIPAAVTCAVPTLIAAVAESEACANACEDMWEVPTAAPGADPIHAFRAFAGRGQSAGM